MMTTTSETSDASLLDLLRMQGAMGVAELAEATGVTATAVRQRLTRLMSRGMIERQVQRSGRGRPSHKYQLTAKGRRDTGNNYADLAMVLWNEVRAVRDPEVRRGLLSRIAEHLAQMYSQQVRGRTLEEKMESLGRLLAERNVPFTVDSSGELPVLTALSCPYPDLAEQDSAVCAMERMLFSQVLGQDLRLSACRLDGSSCCTFEAS